MQASSSEMSKEREYYAHEQGYADGACHPNGLTKRWGQGFKRD
jgi:hypothetical protein